MRTYQKWQHNTSGDTYIVGVTETGEVVEVTGPIHHSEVDQVYKSGGDFDTDPEDLQWVRQNIEDFRRKE